MARFIEYYCLLFYFPVYAMSAYPTKAAEFALFNGLCYSICGLFCNFSMAVLADRLEKRSWMAKAWVAIAGSAVAIPAIIGCCWPGINFYFAMTCLAVKFALSEGYMAPTIAMMQATEKPELQGGIVSVYLFFTTLMGCLATTFLGALSNFFNASANPLVYGKLVLGCSMVGYAIAIPCFYLAGRSYERYIDSCGPDAEVCDALNGPEDDDDE